jgi:diguanylate cyclase (GGDEF)-like protein/PAS domain S-box-containing protein
MAVKIWSGCGDDDLDRRMRTAILEAVPVGVLAVDARGIIHFANRELESLLGYTCAELRGQPVERLVPDSIRERHGELRSAFASAPDARLMDRGRDLCARHRDGRNIAVEIALKPLLVEGEAMTIASIVDVSERKRLHDEMYQGSTELERRVRERTQELESALIANQALLRDIEVQRAAFARLSREDPLTGLNNRRELEGRLRDEVVRAERLGTPLSLAVMDIDHFKNINDRYGHAVGDLALQRAAALIRQCVRRVDFVARHGGEEFALIMPDAGIAEAREICQRICNAFREDDWQSVIPGSPSVTISIGVSEWSPRLDSHMFLDRVDALMYSAKRAGRDRIAVAEAGGFDIQRSPHASDSGASEPDGE